MTLQRLRTVARVGTRGLLVAGFAGGIWLLASAAAHASAPEGGTSRTAQTALDPVARPALGLLNAVLTTDGHSRPAPGTLAVSGVAPRPETATAPAHHRARSAAASVTGSSTPLLASQATPAGPTLSTLLSTVSDLIRPLRTTVYLVTTHPAPLAIARPAPVPAVTGVPAERGTGAAGTAGALAARVHHSTAAVRPSVGAASRTAHAATRHAVPGSRKVPDLPERAPVPAYPGSDTTGISTTASGSGHDAGGYAVVHAPVPAGQRAGQRWLRAAGAQVRLLLADAPTFAPD